MKCKNCKEIYNNNDDKKKCEICKLQGCNKCIELACCDCGYILCKSCRNSNINCGCYGKCFSCNTDVNRGEDGWPCNKCKKWYCGKCRFNSKCKECNGEDD